MTMRRVLAYAAITAVAIALAFGIPVFSASREDHTARINTARALLAGKSVDRSDYNELYYAACLVSLPSRFFYEQVAKVGLERKKVEGLCALRRATSKVSIRYLEE